MAHERFEGSRYLLIPSLWMVSLVSDMSFINSSIVSASVSGAELRHGGLIDDVS